MGSELYKYSAKAPGSLMIMGEHAVLYGSPAIVASIDKFLKVELKVTESKNNTPEVVITSDINKYLNLNADNNNRSNLVYKANLNNIDLKQNYFRYILAVIDYFKEDLLKSNYNYDFNISSEINPNMGLGSSAAVTVASIAVILKFMQIPAQGRDDSQILKSKILKSKILKSKILKSKILKIGIDIINQIQGGGSGGDLLASIYGGVLYYKYNKDILSTPDRIADYIPLAVIYSGYKLSTKKAIKIMADSVNKDRDNNNNFNYYKNIFNIISNLVNQAKIFIQNKNWIELGKLFNQHYGLQDAIGVSDINISNIVYKLREDKNIYGSKISGSGLGDCVIGLGLSDNYNFGYEMLDVSIYNAGITC